jgi:hypothetical protein
MAHKSQFYFSFLSSAYDPNLSGLSPLNFVAGLMVLDLILVHLF